MSKHTNTEPDRDRLRPLLRPRNIALIGASERASHAVALMRNLVDFGFPKQAIIPVNPRYETLFDLPCYPRVQDIPGDVDLAAFAIPRDRVVPALADCCAKGVKAALMVATGFGEADARGREYQAEISRLVHEHGMVLCGPNTLGYLALETGVALWSTNLPQLKQGPIGALFSSSGLLNLFLNSAADRGLGFRYAIAPGNQVGAGFTDYLGWLVDDSEVRVIVTIIESMNRPEEIAGLLELARERNKIIISLRLGRSKKGSTAIASHSGNMATQGAVWEGLFRQKGVISVNNMDEMLETTALATMDPDPLNFPTSGGVGIVTISGGDCSFLADICERNAVALPDLATGTYDNLRPYFGKENFNGNPLDIEDLHFVDETKYQGCLETFVQDENFAVICCRLNLPRKPNDRIKELYRQSAATAQKHHKKIIFLSRASELLDAEWFQFFADLELPFLLEYEKSLRAVRDILALSRARSQSAAPEHGRPLVTTESVATFHASLTTAGGRPLGYAALKELLTAYGIPLAPADLVSSKEGAVSVAQRIGFPVALKVESADLPHKTEVGGLLLGMQDEAAVAAGYTELTQHIAAVAPKATIDGILVQKMTDGIAEVIIGGSQTTDLGPCIVFGLGGIYTEVLEDVVFGLPPLSDRDAENMICAIKAYPVLTGARGKPKGDLDALARALTGLSQLVWDLRADIEEVELNPLMVLPEGQGVVAVDTLIRLKS